MPPRNKKRIKNPDGTWSKRPIKQQIVKRKQIEDADGWTRVIGPHQHEIHEAIDTNVVYIERNLEEMSAQHDKLLKRWQESETRKTLTTEIVEFERISDVKVKNIVCLGLGTLSNGNFTQQNNRHAQLAALMDVVDMLGDSEKPTLIAQDPVFGSCDKSFLESLGFRIFENPSAFEAIDGDSLVYAVHCHEGIYEEIAKANRPAIMIGNDIEELCDSRNASELLKLLSNDYKEISVEPVLSKRRDRTDSFDQIFYSAFYATRLYLRTSTNSHKSLHDTASREEFPTQIRGGSLSLEYNSVPGGSPEEILELMGNENGSFEENSTPVAQRRPPPFEIFEDPDSRPENNQPDQENPPMDASGRDPEFEEDLEVGGEDSDVPEDREVGEDSDVQEDTGVEENPEIDGDSEDEEYSDFWEDTEFDENKENYPPPNRRLGKVQEMEYTRQTEQDLANKRSSIHGWVPGLRLNNLPAFNSGCQEGLGFIFLQHILARTQPLS